MGAGATGGQWEDNAGEGPAAGWVEAVEGSEVWGKGSPHFPQVLLQEKPDSAGRRGWADGDVGHVGAVVPWAAIPTAGRSAPTSDPGMGKGDSQRNSGEASWQGPECPYPHSLPFASPVSKGANASSQGAR